MSHRAPKRHIADALCHFLATGGTESEWAEHDFQINIDYQLLCRTDQYLSFVVTSVEDWSNAYESYWYYNLELFFCKLKLLASHKARGDTVALKYDDGISRFVDIKRRVRIDQQILHCQSRVPHCAPLPEQNRRGLYRKQLPMDWSHHLIYVLLPLHFYLPVPKPLPDRW